MTIAALALALCINANNIALATPAQQVAACAAQPSQIKAAYQRQAEFIIARAGP